MAITVTPRKSGKKFMVDITYTKIGEAGSRRFRRVPNILDRKILDQWATITYGKLIRGEPIDGAEEEKVEKIPTLAEFWPRYVRDYVLAERQKHSTQTTKESLWRLHLAPGLGGKRLSEIDAGDVQALKGRLAEKSVKLSNNVLGLLSSMLTQAAEWKVVPVVPVKIELAKVPKKRRAFYTEDEVDRLLVAARKVRPEAEAVVLLGVDAGLRAGEMMALQWGDLDLVRGQVNVGRAVWRGHEDTPKGAHYRPVPLTARLLASLKGLRPKTALSKSGRVLDGHGPRQLRTWMASAQKLAGIANHGGGRERDAGRVHILRHTFGARLAAAGASPLEIMELMGHANLSTTEIYLHLFPGARERAVKMLERRAVG